MIPPSHPIRGKGVKGLPIQSFCPIAESRSTLKLFLCRIVNNVAFVTPLQRPKGDRHKFLSRLKKLTNRKNYLLMHAMGANTGGQIGSVLAASVMLSLLKGMGII